MRRGNDASMHRGFVYGRTAATQRVNRGPESTRIAEPRLLPVEALKQAAHQRGIQAYQKWHWGEKPTAVLRWDDPDMPPQLVECGRFIELMVKMVRTGRIRGIQSDPAFRDRCFLAYDPNHRFQRLYVLLSRPGREAIKAALWDPTGPSYPLARLAQLFPGRHATRDYPNVQAQLVGTLLRCTYGTVKRADGPSHYFHRHGESTGKHPGVAIDEHGRLWIVGGDSVAPVEGITD